MASSSVNLLSLPDVDSKHEVILQVQTRYYSGSEMDALGLGGQGIGQGRWEGRGKDTDEEYEEYRI